VVEAAKKSLVERGSGLSSVRFICGTQVDFLDGSSFIRNVNYGNGEAGDCLDGSSSDAA